jgi:hypothetical protein
MATTEKKKSKKIHANGKFVTAFTHADDDQWLPPVIVVGELEVYHVAAFDSDQFLVDGVGVDETTITPISKPTPDLIRILKKKSLEWERQDHKLAKRRGLEDGNFREKRKNKEFEVHLIREDRCDAFSAYCDEMRNENRRMSAQRRAEVTKLVKMFKKEGPVSLMSKGKGRAPRSGS